MKKIIAWLLVLTLTAAISIGATLAYLTDTDEDVNVMTLGKVRIDQLEYERIDDETRNEDAEIQEFRDNKPLYPGVYETGYDFGTGDANVDWTQIGKGDYTTGIWNPEKINNELDKMVFVKNEGNYDAFVRTIFAFEAGNYTTLDQFESMMHLNLNETDFTWEWELAPITIGQSKYFVAIATYNKVLEPGALTEISLSQIALDKTATNDDVKAFGETYQILVKSQGIQADGFTDAATALNEGFGTVDADNVPWKTDAPIVGATMSNALHYLNGDPTGTKITNKVTKVVYGRRSQYPEIVSKYDGILSDAEQDMAVYTYYVPNGSNYDLYMLSNGTIYAPKDSSSMFNGMKALKTVDTSNLDVSRVENMYSMFLNCQNLTTLDTSNWDTSKVKDMGGMFANCYVLSELDTSGWDLSNVETLYFTFQKCYELRELDVSNWGLENVTTLQGTFAYAGLTSLDASNWKLSNNTSLLDTFKYCYDLKTVDATGWDTSNVTSTKRMFFHTTSIENVVGIENWDLSKNTDLYYMFEECDALTTVNLSGWKLGSATTLQGLFFNCDSLQSVDVSNWDTSKVTTLYAMFHYCISLQEVKGIGTWDVSSVTNMEQVFRNCRKLEYLDVKDWRPSSCTTFISMFSDSTANTGAMTLKDLDVSQWDMSSAQNINYMFYGCGQLTDLDLSAWDVSNVTTMYHTFADCFKMENYNFSGWDTSKLTVMDGIFNGNRALKVIDVSDFDTQNVTDFDQFFDGCSVLETVIGMDQWDTSSGKYFVELFTGTQVREVDLSSFDMSKAEQTYNMFLSNPQLTTIYVSDKWNLDPSKVTSSGNMFGYNPKLTGGNGSTTATLKLTDVTYANVDTPETPGYLTHIKDKPVNP